MRLSHFPLPYSRGKGDSSESHPHVLLCCSVEEGSTQRVGLLQSLFYTTVEESVRMQVRCIRHSLYCGVEGRNGFKPSSTLQ